MIWQRLEYTKQSGMDNKPFFVVFYQCLLWLSLSVFFNFLFLILLHSLIFSPFCSVCPRFLLSTSRITIFKHFWFSLLLFSPCVLLILFCFFSLLLSSSRVFSSVFSLLFFAVFALLVLSFFFFVFPCVFCFLFALSILSVSLPSLFQQSAVLGNLLVTNEWTSMIIKRVRCLGMGYIDLGCGGGKWSIGVVEDEILLSLPSRVFFFLLSIFFCLFPPLFWFSCSSLLFFLFSYCYVSLFARFPKSLACNRGAGQTDRRTRQIRSR